MSNLLKKKEKKKEIPDLMMEEKMNHRWHKDFFCHSLVSLVTLCLFRFHTIQA